MLPQITGKVAGIEQRAQVLGTAGAGDGREPLVLAQAVNLVEGQRIEEVRGVRGDEDLSTPLGVVAELLGQFRQQLRVKLVLGLLDSQQRIGLGVVEQHQIGKHLDGAVRDMAGDERVLEAAVLEAQHEPAVFRLFGFHHRDARHPALHGMQHAVEAVAMMLEQVVGHQRQVVFPGREVFGKAVFLAGAGLGDVEVGYVPVLDHQTEGTGRLEALELPQAFDGEDVRGVQFLLLTGQVFVGLGEVFLVGDGIALACREVEEAEGCTVGATLVAQDLALDDRAPAFSVGPDLQRVSNEPVISGDLQAKLQSDLNGFIRETAARHLAVASSLGQRLGHVHRQGVLEKGEHVEQGGLAGAIGPHQHAQARNVFQLHIAEQPVVLDGDGFDLHGGTFQSNVAGQRMSIRSFPSRWLPEPRSTILLTSTKWSETGWPDTSQAALALEMTVPKLRDSSYPSRCCRSLASQYSTPPSVCWACPSKVLVNAWTSSDFMCSPFGCAAGSWRRTPLALSRRSRPASATRPRTRQRPSGHGCRAGSRRAPSG